jgi:hypothetical protein
MEKSPKEKPEKKKKKSVKISTTTSQKCLKETAKVEDKQMEEDDYIDDPFDAYRVSSSNLKEIICKIVESHNNTIDFSNKETRFQFFEDLFNEMDVYTDPTAYIKKIPRKHKVCPRGDINTHLTKPSYTEKITRGLFLIDGRYKYLRVKIAPSTIKKAGMGVYAYDPIPEDAKITYSGNRVHESDCNPFYSWEIKPYDPNTGDPLPSEDELFYIDAVDSKCSNLTRNINCGMTSEANNMDAVQIFGNFYYIALTDIKPGEELFVDYGDEYRTVNLKMKGTY